MLALTSLLLRHSAGHSSRFTNPGTSQKWQQGEPSITCSWKARAGPWPVWPHIHPWLFPCYAGLCRCPLQAVFPGPHVKWCLALANRRHKLRKEKAFPFWPQATPRLQLSRGSSFCWVTLTSGLLWPHHYFLSFWLGWVMVLVVNLWVASPSSPDPCVPIL